MTTERTRQLNREAVKRYQERHPDYPGYRRKWQKANRERCRLYSRRWREKNPEKLKQQSIRQRTVNREAYLAMRKASHIRCQEQERRYVMSQPERWRLYRKEFFRKHRERWDRYKQLRRAAIAKTKASKDHKAIEAIYARARQLRKCFDVCVDHIIPLCKGGHHVPDNLQIIYKFENLIKAKRLGYKPKVVFL